MAAAVRREAAPGQLGTVFALASGAPPAAIAIIRISGPDAWAAAAALAGPLPPPRTVGLRRIVDPADGSLLDRGLVLPFEAASSPTGEAVAELHLHGGRAVVGAVLAALARQPGLQPAGPGDFTWRAFRNGRVDLSGVEGLADLIQADTEAQRRAALAIAEGGLSALVEDWQAELLSIGAAIEAELDFADEDDVVSQDHGRRLSRLREAIAAMLDAPSAERLRDGPLIVIAGPPNSGKSSLLNMLVGREAAIVTDVPGTTRDVVEVPAIVHGVAVRLTDTAGLRQTTDTVERIGVSRAEDRMAIADLVLWLGDDDPPHLIAPVIRVHARADLSERQCVPEGRVRLSTCEADGGTALVAVVGAWATQLPARTGMLTLNERQRTCLADAHDSLEGMPDVEDLLLLGEAVRHGLRAFDRLTGRAGAEDMLSTLFGRFCIGK